MADQAQSGAVAALQRSAGSNAPGGPLVLVIMDGVGIGAQDEFDAFHLARTPNIDLLRETSLVTQISAHGVSVGLPSDADMGNSEVGHNTMGAGRILDQGATRVDKALESGAIWGDTWRDMIDWVLKSGGTLHLLGLLSDGNVHSNMQHLDAIVRRAASDGVTRVRLHALFDGRDVPDGSAELYVSQIEKTFSEQTEQGHDYRLASAGGRMLITMDRYGADWAMVERGWKTHVLGEARSFSSGLEGLNALRVEHPGVSDQFLPEFVVVDEEGVPLGRVVDGDAVLFFNFRGDRALEMSRAFVEPEFAEFERGPLPDVYFAGLMLYDGDTNMPPHRLVEPDAVDGTVSELLAAQGVRQFACAETQKYGHVTYFWNGNRSESFDPSLETYVEIPSDSVPFEQRPWMKSAETADAVCEAVGGQGFDFIRTNFAGGDMVGHSGQLTPTILAIEAIDLALGRIVQSVSRSGGCLVLTADHGNAEDMALRDKHGHLLADEEGKAIPKTSHSLEPIPFIVRDYGGRTLKLNAVPAPGLANIAATVCVLLGFDPPTEYKPSLVSMEAYGTEVTGA